MTKEHLDNYWVPFGKVEWETDLKRVSDGDCCLVRYIYETPFQKINKIAFALKKYGIWHVADYNFLMKDEEESVEILTDHSRIKDDHILGFIIFYKKENS